MKKGSDSEVSNVGYNNAFTNDYPCVLIRLADLYLMKAEAWNEYLAVPDEEHVYAPLNEDVYKRQAPFCMSKSSG